MTNSDLACVKQPRRGHKSDLPNLTSFDIILINCHANVIYAFHKLREQEH